MGRPLPECQPPARSAVYPRGQGAASRISVPKSSSTRDTVKLLCLSRRAGMPLPDVGWTGFLAGCMMLAKDPRWVLAKPKVSFTLLRSDLIWSFLVALPAMSC